MVKINTDYTKCEHGTPIQDDCEKCSKFLEKKKKDAVEWINQLEEAHKNTSKSDLRFGENKRTTFE